MRQLWHSRRAGPSEGPRWLFFTLLSGLMAWLAAGGIGGAGAQEPAGKAEAPAPAPAPAVTKEAPAAPAGGEAAPAPASSPATPATAGDGTTPPRRENMLQWAMRASGPIGFFLLLLSIYFTALVIRLFMEFRVSEAVPAVLVDR